MRIYVDLDSVLNQLAPRWLQLIKEQLGEDVPLESITSWDVLGAPRYQDLLKTPGLFRELAVEPGADTVIQRMAVIGYEVFVVSAARPAEYVDKHAWLQEHFPYIPERHIIFAACKDELAQPGRVLIDDGPHNITAWRNVGGEAVVCDQPWNREVEGPRLKHWTDLPLLVEGLERR